MARRIGDPPAADQAMSAVDADVVLVAKGRDREVDARPLSLFGLALVYLSVQRASRSFWRSLAGLSAHAGGMRPSLMSRFSPSVLRCGDDRSVDDLAAHRQQPGRRERRIKALKQNLDRRSFRDPGAGQRLAKAPDRIGIGHRVGQPQAEKPHKRQPVADQSLPRRRPGYSVRSSDRLWLDWRISTLNIST